MLQAELQNLQFSKSTLEICNDFTFVKEVNEDLISYQDINPPLFLEKLFVQQLYNDAINFLAHGLKKTQALQWGYICFEDIQAKNKSQHSNFLEIFQEWFTAPTDTLRRKIGEEAEKIGFKNPLAWLGMALFWSEGSITPLEGPSILADHRLTGRALSTALTLAAAIIEPQNIDIYYKHFIEKIKNLT